MTKPLAGVTVSRETLERLELYADLTLKWSKTINLVAKSTYEDVWSRHIADSAQLWPFVDAPKTWVDLGSGGGFPGMVIAILTAEHGTAVHLVEADQRKCAFLRSVARETNIPVHIHATRIEDATLPKADVVSARALARFVNLLKFAEVMLVEGGCGLFPKGQQAQSEIDEARGLFQFDLDTYASVTHPGAKILKVSNISHA